MTLQPGLRGSAQATVTDADTARALGSGDVDVLGTPRLVALLEAAAVDALRGALDHGTTSVGVALEVEHLAATPVGGTVLAEATLTQVDGRTLHFTVQAHDDHRQVARGEHHRALVDRERFLQRVTAG